jgi:4-hydroxy-tetrahydrodipicolinate synthase
MMMTDLEPAALAGVIVPVITPVDSEDRVDELAFRRILRWLIDAGVHGLFVGGSAGVGPLLVAHEWQRLMEIASDEVNGALPLLGGAIDTSTRRIQEKIGFLAGLGYKYAVVTPAYYYTLQTSDEHLRLFSECAASSPGVAVVAYNIPACTHSEIPVEVITELARRGVLKYCKNSSPDPAYFRRLMAEAAPFGLKVFMGDEPQITEALLGGASGIVPVCANLEPQTFIQAYQAGLRLDRVELSRLQARILVLRLNVVQAGTCWIAGINAAMAALGFGSGIPVSPLQPLTAGELQKLGVFMRAGRPA